MSSNNSPARLISIVRRQRDIIALVSDVERAPAKSNDTHAAGLPPRYQNHEIALENVPVRLCPQREQILTAWRELAAVKALDESILLNILIILLNTVPDTVSGSRKLAPLDEFAEPERVRPTAAHPRGFRGTKYRPPKARRFPLTDLREYLLEPESLRKIADQLAAYLPQITKRLRREGYEEAELETYVSLLSQKTGSATRRSSISLGKVSPEFLCHLWPMLMSLPEEQVSDYRRLFHKLELAENRPLLWAVSRLVSLQPDLTTIGWCRLVERLPSERRVAFVSRLIESANYQLPSDTLAPKNLDLFNQIAADEVFEEWLERLHWSLQHGIPVSYLLTGFRLSVKLGWRHRFSNLRFCDEFPEQLAEELDGLWESEYGRGFVAMPMWERCGQLPGFAEIMQRPWLRNVPTKTGFKFFDSIQRCAYYDVPQAQLDKKWSCIRKQLPKIEEIILSVPEDYQSKAIGYIFDCLWCWDKPVEIDSRLPTLIRLLRLTCQPPFRKGYRAADAMECFLQSNSPACLDRFLAAPQKSWIAIEDGCARENNAGLISRGLETIVKYHARLTVDAFIHFPKLLMKVAKNLGTLKSPVRDQLCKELCRHPLLQCDPSSLPLRELCRYVESECGAHYFNPASAKLKSWAQGNVDLSPVRIARDQRLLIVNLTRTRLEVIEHAVMDRLSKPVVDSLPTKNARHALQLLSTSDYNRRGLRRFLQAYFSGDRCYLANHPATKRWYHAHSRVKRDLWEQGIQFHKDGMSIQVERDPLEILKMGTYVGSCLGLGGLWADSSAAALLDANKRVLFARDSRGTVVGRQLVAISENDQLVCFRVYPTSLKGAAKNIFRQYDQSFAAALGLDLYREDDSREGYEILKVISQSWWDDSAWNFEEAE